MVRAHTGEACAFHVLIAFSFQNVLALTEFAHFIDLLGLQTA